MSRPQFRRPSRPGKSKPYVPDRGDVVWLDFSPQKGREQAERRPAVVLSPANYNEKASLAVVCPITNEAKGYPFEVAIPKGQAATGVVLADQIKSLDWRARRAEFKGEFPDDLVRQVLEKAMVLINPEEEEGGEEVPEGEE